MNIGQYFMDDPREAKRLADKVQPKGWVDGYLRPLLDGDERILDVGCGPGALGSELGATHPRARVTGVDLHVDRFAGVPASGNVDLREGDAHCLPFPDEAFDLVYSRFLLEYLQDKQKAVDEMVRVCAPGGHVLLQDLDGQLVWHYAPDSEMEEQLGSVLAGLAHTGFDTLVGRKLFSMAKAAGLAGLRVTVEPYHLIAGRIDPLQLQLWETKLDIALPAAARLMGDEGLARELKLRMLDYLRREDTFTYSVVITVIGTKTVDEDQADDGRMRDRAA